MSNRVGVSMSNIDECCILLKGRFICRKTSRHDTFRIFMPHQLRAFVVLEVLDVGLDKGQIVFIKQVMESA